MGGYGIRVLYERLEVAAYIYFESSRGCGQRSLLSLLVERADVENGPMKLTLKLK